MRALPLNASRQAGSFTPKIIQGFMAQKGLDPAKLTISNVAPPARASCCDGPLERPRCRVDTSTFGEMDFCMILARSLGRKVLVTAIAACGFVALYEVTMLDSQNLSWRPAATDSPALPFPGERLSFSATAYCKGLVTSAGVAAQPTS